MPYVICKLPNAAEEINGVKFEKVGRAMVSVESVDDDAAAVFAAIDGYELSDSKPSAKALQSDDLKSDEAGADEADAQPAQEGKKPAPARKRKAEN